MFPLSTLLVEVSFVLLNHTNIKKKYLLVTSLKFGVEF